MFFNPTPVWAYSSPSLALGVVLITTDLMLVTSSSKSSSTSASAGDLPLALPREYCAIIPEWIINDMGWYEDTKLSWKIDDGNVIITEEDE